MARKPSLNATFFAFRRRSEGGGVLLRASLGFAICVFALVAAYIAFAHTLIGGWASETWALVVDGGPMPSESAPPEGWRWVMLAGLLFVFLVFLAMASYEAACLRWLIRGQRSGGLLGLTLGADVWRVYLTYWLWLALAAGIFVICMFAFAGVGYALMNSSISASETAGTAAFVVLGLLAVLALIVFVRFSAAAATSVARGKFAFFDAWEASSGRFWALLGAFLLLAIMNVVAGVLFQMIAVNMVLDAALSDLNWVDAIYDPEAFKESLLGALVETLTTPSALVMIGVFTLVAFALSLMFRVLFFGVNARVAVLALEEGRIKGRALAA